MITNNFMILKYFIGIQRIKVPSSPFPIFFCEEIFLIPMLEEIGIKRYRTPPQSSNQ